MKLGFVGIGRMGAPMVQRLLTSGFTVVVWNRTREKLDAVTAVGAQPASSLQDLASRADFVLSMVTDDAAVEAIFSQGDGLLSEDVSGKIFVDMSTILPDTARRVAAAVCERGASFIDAPVAGTVQPARDGRLLIFAGGDATDVEQLRPVFTTLARRVEHLGPVGSGAAMKLVHNTLLSTYWGVLGEAMTLGRQYGLDFKRMLEVIVESPANFSALGVKIPTLLGQQSEVGFNLTNVRKDLRTIHSFADSLNVSMRIATATLQTFEEAVASGRGDEDVSSIAQ